MAEVYGSAVRQKYRDQANQVLAKYGRDPWSYQQKDLRDAQAEFSNYLSSGNYTTENNQKYRDMATKAVADLDNEMKRYTKSSDEYKTLDSYKQYYSNALPDFDRMDVGVNANNYITADAWHSKEEYELQRSALQSSIDNIQTEMDALGETESDNYKKLKSYRDWYQSIMDGGESGYGLTQREAHDRYFKDADEYVQFQRSQDYNNNVQTKQTLLNTQEQLKQAQADFAQAQNDFNLGRISYQDLALADQSVKKLEEQITSLNNDLSALERYQRGEIYNNYVDEYGEDADYKKIVDGLIEDRNKAESLYGKNSPEYEKIDLTIKVLAGENEGVLSDENLVTDSTLYGKSVLRDFDRESAQKRIDEIDARLAEMGADQTAGMALLNSSSGGTGLSIHQGESTANESKEAIDLRAERLNLQRLLNSSEMLQRRDTAQAELPKTEGYEQLVAAGKNATVANEAPNGMLTYSYRLPGYDKNAEDSERAKYSRALYDFGTIADDERYQWLTDMIYAAIGAEVEGKDIGYTVQDLMDMYGGMISQEKGLQLAKKVSDIDSDFLRWNAQVLGVGTQAGLNQFASGVRQAFSTDYIAPNSTAVMGQATREDIKDQYGGRELVNGATLSQIAFDTVQTTANMLPMMAASAILTGGLGAAGVATATAEKIGEIAGATLMSISSAGNSYQQALAEGWDKRDARLFSTIMGAAEGGMQYFLGGIGKLGGVGEDAILNVAKGINNGLVRWMAETGTHIASEVNEELLQNRLERLLTNYLFEGNEQSTLDCLKWNDDDWYTVIVTALSTGALEGPGTAINLHRQSKLGRQLSGQTAAMSGREEAAINNKLEMQAQALKEGKKAIPSKAQLTASEQNKRVVNAIGKAMQSDKALSYTLITIGTTMADVGTEAYELASGMESGKIAKSAANMGALYSAILDTFTDRMGAQGYDAATMAVIDGAAKYHMESSAEDAVKAAEEKRAQIIKDNPGATVLDENASILSNPKTYGLSSKVATEYGSIMQKVEAGAQLTSAERSKLLGDSTAAKAARLELDKRFGGTLLNDTVERGDIEDAKTVLDKMAQIVKEQKAAKAAETRNAVAAAAQAGADKVSVADAAKKAEMNPDIASAETVEAIQTANDEVEAAQQRLDQIKKMSFREIGALQFGEEQEAGSADATLKFERLAALTGQMNNLNEQADKLAAIKMPSKENRTRLADIRQQQAETKAQLVAAEQEFVDRAVARAKAEKEAEAKAAAQSEATLAGSPADTVVINGANITRDEFLASRKAAIESGERTAEDVNAEFDAMLAGTGNVKENVNGRDQSSNPDGQGNDVHNAADGGEDRSGADQSGRTDVGQSEENGSGISEAEAEEVSQPDNLGGYPSKQEFAEGGVLFEASETNSEIRVGKGAVVYNGFDSWTFSKKTKYSHVTPALGQYLKDSGFTSVRYVTGGRILVTSPKTGRQVSVAAVVRGTELVLALDFRKPGYDPVRTAEHERTHLRLGFLSKAEKYKLINSALEQILTQEEYEAAFQKYLDDAKYGEMYYKSGVTDMTTLGHMIDEEMFCDMAAGLNCWDTELGQYEGAIADFMSESNFDAIADAIAAGEEVPGGLEYPSDTDENALPFGNQMKETLNITDPFRRDVDRTKPPETRPLPGEEALHEDQQLMSIQSMAEAGTVFGFEILENEDGFPYGLRNIKTGEIINEVSPEMMRDTPIGSLVQTAVDKGFISETDAAKEYEMLAETMNLTLKYNDSGLTWELVGSQLFSGIKKNSDTQYNWTIDFGTICRKTQALVNAMSATMKELGHGLSRREIEAVYLETGLAGEATPCPVCYVFSRWMGIGGLLDQINTFQETYFEITDPKTGAFKWADGKSEADLAEFMTDIDNAIVDWAKAKEKKDFFQNENAEDKFNRNNLNFGKILSDMKSGPNRRQADAIKKINDSRQAQLLIAELESRAKDTTPEHAAKILKAADTVRDYVLSDEQIKAQQTKLEDAEAELAKYELYQWADRTVMRRTPGKLDENNERTFQWKMRPEYKPVPQDILFDLNKGGEFAKNYPLTWGFRTGKGNAMGKAIVPYSDARVGETIQGVAEGDVKVFNEEMLDKMDITPGDKKAIKKAMKATGANIRSGASLNPLLNGDTKEWNKIVEKASNAIRRQNLIGGMRMQSTSDFRFEWGSDYLITFFELQAIGANVQLYTKVIEAVDFLASTGADCNLSVMPLGLGYKVDPETNQLKLDFSNVTGINAEEAIKKAKQYDNVQLILVGISDKNIELALAGEDVTFVIPFHGSGQSVDQVQTLVNLLGEDLDVTMAQDYSDVQDDHVSKDQTPEQKAMWKLRMDIIQGKFWKKPTKKNPAGTLKPFTAEQQELFDKNPHLQRLYDMFYNERPSVDENGNPLFTKYMLDDDGKSIAYHCFLGKKQAEKIFPYEYWDTSLNYDQADGNGENFKSYCASMGIVPRFSGINADGEIVDHGNFADKKGYWKLLIDRKMYKNTYTTNENGEKVWTGYGEYRNQQKINVSDVKTGMLNESKVQETINKKAWTKPIKSERTQRIVENSIASIERMREAGDIYDTKKISKEFRQARLGANKDVREAEAEQQRASVQEEDNTPVETKEVFDTPVPNTKVGQYGKYTIPSRGSLTERRAQVYNENTQQRFSKQESEYNGREETRVDSGRSRGVVRQFNKFLQENNWTRSYIEAARRQDSGVKPEAAWRSDERRQRRVVDFAADFFTVNTIDGERVDHLHGENGEPLFEYGVPDFLDWFFREAADDPDRVADYISVNMTNGDKFLRGLERTMTEQREPELSYRTYDPKDQEYLEAVEANDIEKLQKMVKEAAEKAGYDLDFYQHAAVHFEQFSKGEFGFHVGSWTQAAQFVNGAFHNFMDWGRSEYPDLFLHLYADIKNPYILPLYDLYGKGKMVNDYSVWDPAFIAERLLGDEKFFVGKNRSDVADAKIELQSVIDEERGHVGMSTKISDFDYDSPLRKRVTNVLEKMGYDALEYTNNAEGNKSRDSGEAFIVWDPSKLKSADLITYDYKGNIVPLSDRFNKEDNWFRYSMQEEETPVSNPFAENTLEHDLMAAILERGDKGAAEWATKELAKQKQKLESAKIIPPRVPTKSFVPMPTKEEMAAIEKERLDRIGKWGSLPPSEKADSDWVLPRKDEEGRAQSRFPQNVVTANVLDEPAKNVTKRFAFTDQAATHVVDSNAADLKHAKDTIQRKGYERSVASFLDMAEEMTWHYAGDQSLTKVLALGQQLLVESSKQGTYRDYLDVLSSLTLLATQAGKSLQAFRMLKETGPIGELYYVQKTVDQMNNKKYAKLIESGKQKPITVKPELSKAVVLAATEEERNKAMDKLIASIAEQIPVNFMEKWNAWRHFAMLGNARTHIRNLAGNGIFVPLRFAKDLMATAGESIAVATGKMKESDRTKALVVSAELRDFAKKDALVMQKELQGNGKYNPAQEILDARQIFKVKALDKASKWNGQMLEKEDWWFLAPAYQKALAAALSHTGYTVKELQTTKEGQKALNNARRIAIEEAQRATYRDFSVAAAALNRLKSGGGAAGILLEGVLPFTKTPINILRRGVEYSPIGMITALTGLAKDYKAGNIDAAKFIDRMSAGMTGTMVAILGYLLAKMGWLRGKKDDKEEDFDKLQGHQDYSLEIGGVSATIDWAAPTALPLFTGAAAHDLMEGDEKLSISTVWDTMMLIAEPMMSLSMLDGLNRTLSAASYAGENEKVASIVTSAMTSYFGQGVPTLLGQLARSMDGTRRQTYVDKNSPVPAGMQRFIQTSIQNKIPIWEEQKSAYIDQWGREDTTSSKALGTLENFLSPSYWSMVKTTDVDAALQELYSATKESSVLPSSPTKEVNGHKLTADEYESYAKDVGSTKYAMMSMLVHDPRYQALSDEEKILAVEKIYKYANCAGKYHFDQTYNIRKNGGVWVQEAEAMLTDQQRYERIWQAIEDSLKD